MSDELRAKFWHVGNESAVIACVLKDPSNYFEVESKLNEQDFLTPKTKALWTVIKSLVRQEIITFDLTSIMHQANALGLTDEQIGGYDYVDSLFLKNVNSGNIDFYIKKVLDASLKYKISLAAIEIIETADKNRALTDSGHAAEDLIADAQAQFIRISADSHRASDAEDLASDISEVLAEAVSNPSNVLGLSTGLGRLDAAINGLIPGSLTVIGARPKVGKSALLMNIAKYVAYTSGVNVLYIDTEMSKREQQYRLVSTLSGVKERDIKNGMFNNNPQEKAAVENAEAIIKSGMIKHKYYPDFTADGVAAMVRKHQYQDNIGFVIFDYIKLPDSDLKLLGNVKEHQSIGFLCTALKNLAGQLQIPVLTAAQISREGSNKGGKLTSSSFADSDRILRYANTLLGLTQKSEDEIRDAEEKYGREQASRLAMGTHRLQILDTRSGGANYTGIDLYFRKSTLTVREADVQLYELEKRNSNEEDED